jgi:pSer/pThr/pTyr-binding forkhead associated (FHA) protein
VRRSSRSEANARFLIQGPDVAIGRVAGNDVVLDDPSVSARHARLRLAGGIWTLADLGSINGSRVDGEPVLQALPVAPGSIVRFGEVELAFGPRDRWEDSPVESPPKAAPAAGRVASNVLEVPERRAIPAPVLIGLTVIALGVIGYLLARGG